MSNVRSLGAHRVASGESVWRAAAPHIQRVERAATEAWVEWRNAAVRRLREAGGDLLRLRLTRMPAALRDVRYCGEQIDYYKCASAWLSFVRWYAETSP